MNKTNYTAEQLTNYVNCCIKDMEDSYSYASHEVVKRHGAEDAQRYYRTWVTEEKDKAYGAIQFAWIFLEVIDEVTYKELDSELDLAYHYWYEKSWDIKEAE